MGEVGFVRFFVLFFFFKDFIALASVAQRIEYGPVNQSVAGLLPSEGTCIPGLRARSQ